MESSLVDALIEQLGRDAVVVDGSALELASRTCIPYREIAAIVVYPKDVSEVRVTVELSRKFDAPIWPVSTGKNWGYGEKSACYPGGITMILERMTKIVEVNEELGYAVIEPGVTYKQLNDHLKATGSKLWADASGSTQFASVLGNALDKGRGLTPYADHFGCLCGMDVVLPDGRLLETGGGPTGNNQVRYAYKWGVGPYLDGLFAQSNLGIVVRAGIWLMPAPERFDWAAFEYGAGEDQLAAFHRRSAPPGLQRCAQVASAPGERFRDDVHRFPVSVRSARAAAVPGRRGDGSLAQAARGGALDLRLRPVRQPGRRSPTRSASCAESGAVWPRAVSRRGCTGWIDRAGLFAGPRPSPTAGWASRVRSSRQ